MIFDYIESQNYDRARNTTIQAAMSHEAINLIVKQSCAHAACYLACLYGLCFTIRGEVSVHKLSVATGLKEKECRAILDDIRCIIVKCGVCHG